MQLKCRIIMFFVFFVFVFAFPTTVKAEKLNYYGFHMENQSLIIEAEGLDFGESFSDTEKLQILLENLLKYDENMIKYIPQGTKTEWIRLQDGELGISFSREIMNYGGVFYERAMIYQLLKTVFEVNSVDCVTVYTEGRINYFNEGSLIFRFDREQMWDYEYNFILSQMF